jgi:hypothetical protein
MFAGTLRKSDACDLHRNPLAGKADMLFSTQTNAPDAVSFQGMGGIGKSFLCNDRPAFIQKNPCPAGGRAGLIRKVRDGLRLSVMMPTMRQESWAQLKAGNAGCDVQASPAAHAQRLKTKRIV